MNKETITIEEIKEELYYLDTEYRESLASALIELKYVSDSPLNLSMGTERQQEELRRVNKMPLKANQIKEIIEFMMNEMKDDFQYKDFEPIALRFMKFAKQMQEENSEELE